MVIRRIPNAQYIKPVIFQLTAEMPVVLWKVRRDKNKILHTIARPIAHASEFPMSDAIEVTRRRLLAAGLSLPAAALANSPSLKAVGLFTESGKRYVVDLYGRRVEIPSVVKRFVCTGTGALRITSYLKAFDRLVGIESTDQRYRHDPKRDYAYANHAFFKTLPIIGKGGGNAFTANPEAILSLEPDVIFTGYAPEATEQLARETGLPVISVSYRSLGIVHDTFFEAIKLVGSVLGLEKRAQSVIEFVAKATADLERRLKDGTSL